MFSPFEKRLDYLCDTYGSFNVDDLKEATIRIQKKLGGLETRNTIQFLTEGKIKDAFAILLKYYDKFYDKATSTRLPGTIEKNFFEEINPSTMASSLTTKQAQPS